VQKNVEGYKDMYVVMSDSIFLRLDTAGGAMTDYEDGTAFISQSYKEMYERMPFGKRILQFISDTGESKLALGQYQPERWMTSSISKNLVRETQYLLDSDAWIVREKGTPLLMAVYVILVTNLMALLGSTNMMFMIPNVPWYSRVTSVLLMPFLTTPVIAVMIWLRVGNLLIRALAGRVS